MILVQIEGVKGDCKIKGFENYFTAESFGFGVERELADSAKGGTADVNIGVGEMQECTLSKSMDTASNMLARKAISGSSCKEANIKFVEAITDKAGERWNLVYLWFKLDNVFVKSWSVSGDGDDRPSEDVALWYNKLAFGYYPTEDGISFDSLYDCKWDQVKARAWTEVVFPTSAQKFKAD